jgi:periodic tryptophan protein 1
MSMTLATTWVRRGVAAPFPVKYEVDEAELKRISKLARLQLADAKEDLNEAQGSADQGAEANETDEEDDEQPNRSANVDTTPQDDELHEYKLQDYDDEEPDETGEKFAMFGNVRSLAYHRPGEDDPYLVLPEGGNASDDEREELQILPTDNLILAAKVEDEVAHLEVFVYEDDADNLYVHHDIMLPAVPLCVEWIDLPVGKDAGQRPNGNFVAVGTMSPEIEIWDLDVVDNMYPDAILGQEPSDGQEKNGDSSRGTKSKKKKLKRNDEYHVDAVLALAANRLHRNLLASASADKTVKLWDLNSAKCAKSYSMHSGKVCALDWHPSEATVLLSGSYDKSVVATDMRAPDATAPKWIVDSDVERVRWDIHDPNFFYVTTESGIVNQFDARSPPKTHTSPSKPIWMLQAHDGPVSAFDINPTVPGYLATGSEDKKIKLWNVEDNKPSMVVSRDMGVGRIFAAHFAPDPEVAFRLSVAGSKGHLQVWDTSTNPSVRNAFGGRVKMPEAGTKERLVGTTGDNEDSESDDEEDGGTDTMNAGDDGWESMDED